MVEVSPRGARRGTPPDLALEDKAHKFTRPNDSSNLAALSRTFCGQTLRTQETESPGRRKRWTLPPGIAFGASTKPKPTKPTRIVRKPEPSDVASLAKIVEILANAESLFRGTCWFQHVNRLFVSRFRSPLLSGPRRLAKKPHPSGERHQGDLRTNRTKHMDLNASRLDLNANRLARVCSRLRFGTGTFGQPAFWILNRLAWSDPAPSVPTKP